MVNWIAVTHGPDGIGNIKRPAMFAIDARPFSDCACSQWPWSAIWYGGCRKRRSDARCARCATTSWPPASPASTSIGPKSSRSRCQRVLGGIGGGLFAGGFAYVSPDQFSFAESIVFITMALLGGVASPVGA